MGSPVEFNWALKLKPEQGLAEGRIKEGEIYFFVKDSYRIYPLNIPIELMNENWEAVALVFIIESSMRDNKTEGKYKVLKIYAGEEKLRVTNYVRERTEYQVGHKIEDWRNFKST